MDTISFRSNAQKLPLTKMIKIKNQFFRNIIKLSTSKFGSLSDTHACKINDALTFAFLNHFYK